MASVFQAPPSPLPFILRPQLRGGGGSSARFTSQLRGSLLRLLAVALLLARTAPQSIMQRGVGLSQSLGTTAGTSWIAPTGSGGCMVRFIRT